MLRDIRIVSSGFSTAKLSSLVHHRLTWTGLLPLNRLQEGIALKRLLPWLWPLADTASPAAAQAASFPPDLCQCLLAALEAYPLPSHHSGEAGTSLAEHGVSSEAAGEFPTAAAGAGGMGEKRELLLSALRAVWDP